MISHNVIGRKRSCDLHLHVHEYKLLTRNIGIYAPAPQSWADSAGVNTSKNRNDNPTAASDVSLPCHIISQCTILEDNDDTYYVQPKRNYTKKKDQNGYGPIATQSESTQAIEDCKMTHPYDVHPSRYIERTSPYKILGNQHRLNGYSSYLAPELPGKHAL